MEAYKIVQVPSERAVYVEYAEFTEEDCSHCNGTGKVKVMGDGEIKRYSYEEWQEMGNELIRENKADRK